MRHHLRVRAAIYAEIDMRRGVYAMFEEFHYEPAIIYLIERPFMTTCRMRRFHVFLFHFSIMRALYEH